MELQLFKTNGHENNEERIPTGTRLTAHGARFWLSVFCNLFADT
jgi:hypothetical protein